MSYLFRFHSLRSLHRPFRDHTTTSQHVHTPFLVAVNSEFFCVVSEFRMDSLVQRRIGFLSTNFILWIFLLSIVSSYSSSESETIVERKNTSLKKTPRRTRKILRGRRIPALPCDKDNNDDDMDALEVSFNLDSMMQMNSVCE